MQMKRRSHGKSATSLQLPIILPTLFHVERDASKCRRRTARGRVEILVYQEKIAS
jgi:hypothetical protein